MKLPILNNFSAIVFPYLLAVLLLGSCAISNDVVTGNRLQKRKYQKGFHVHKVKENKNNSSYQAEGELSKRDALISSSTIPKPDNVSLKSPKRVSETSFENGAERIKNKTPKSEES